MFKNSYQSGFLSILYSIGYLSAHSEASHSRSGTRKFGMVTSKDSQTRIYNHRFSRSWAPTYPLIISLVLLTQRKPWASSSHSLWWSSKTSRSISLSKCKFSMTRMWEGDSELLITKLQRGSNPSFAQCLWGWMRDGIRSSLIFPILHGEPTGQTTSRHCESKFTQIAGSEGYTSRTGCILSKSFPQSSSYSCQSRNNNDSLYRYLSMPQMKVDEGLDVHTEQYLWVWGGSVKERERWELNM